MATWTLTARLTTGTLAVGATDRIWLNGASFGTNVVVGSYQDSTHITNSSDAHQCTTNHVRNFKYISDSEYQLDGGGTTSFSSSAPTTASCSFLFNFSDAASVATSGGRFYAYDGTTDATPMSGVTFRAFEANGSITPAWVAANGLGAALTLQDQAAATSHDFFIGLSMTPTSTGAKTGKVKISLTYV